MDFLVNFTEEELEAVEQAKQGNDQALFDMACAYTKEENQNLQKAATMFELCAENGSFTACKNLVLFYLNGWGVEKDLEKALSYQRICVLEDYSVLPKYAGLARELYGFDEAYELVAAVIEELEENGWYPQNEDAPCRLFAEVLSALSIESGQKQAEGQIAAQHWFEKSAELGNLNSAMLFIVSKKLELSVNILLMCHDAVIEACDKIIYWAQILLDAEQSDIKAKQTALEGYREAILSKAMALHMNKDYKASLNVLSDPILGTDPLAKVLKGCTYYFLADENPDFIAKAQCLTVINERDRWKEMQWDVYTKHFIYIGGLALASLYRYGIIENRVDLEAAYGTLENILTLIVDDEDVRRTVAAEMSKYKRNWLGKLQYIE